MIRPGIVQLAAENFISFIVSLFLFKLPTYAVQDVFWSDSLDLDWKTLTITGHEQAHSRTSIRGILKYVIDLLACLDTLMHFIHLCTQCKLMSTSH